MFLLLFPNYLSIFTFFMQRGVCIEYLLSINLGFFEIVILWTFIGEKLDCLNVCKSE